MRGSPHYYAFEVPYIGSVQSLVICARYQKVISKPKDEVKFMSVKKSILELDKAPEIAFRKLLKPFLTLRHRSSLVPRQTVMIVASCNLILKRLLTNILANSLSTIFLCRSRQSQPVRCTR